MTFGGDSFDYFSDNRLTKFSAGPIKLCHGRCLNLAPTLSATEVLLVVERIVMFFFLSLCRVTFLLERFVM